MQYRFRPLVKWPRASTKGRKSSPFSSTYNQTMRLLDTELAHLSARNVVIQIAVTEREIRLDGLPYATAKPLFPGVILTFERHYRSGRVETLNFPCDAFTTWQDNLRAIALALEALRKIDRYGVTSHQEQYTGWAQLPPGEPTPQTRRDGMSVDEAAEVIARVVAPGSEGSAVPNIKDSPDTFRGCYRTGARELHPDTNGGSEHPRWHEFQAAAEVLKRHHGIA